VLNASLGHFTTWRPALAAAWWGMRRFIRATIPALAGTLVLAIVAGVVSEFFIEWAREERWYDNPSQRLDAAIRAFSSAVTHPAFIYSTSFFIGFTTGFWGDSFLRKREKVASSQAAGVDARGLYVGQCYISLHALEEELVLPITFICYNATGHAVRVVTLNGTIDLNVREGSTVLEKQTLPPPRLALEKLSKEENLAFREFLVIIEQRVSVTAARCIKESLDDKKKISLEFANLAIGISCSDSSTTDMRLPLWDGVVLSKPDLDLGRIKAAKISISGKTKLS
jgi:hypothetical protein